MIETLARPLVLLEGKGGVGKTTTAAAVGLALARRGARTLVVELVPKGHVATLFHREPSMKAPVEVAPRLYTQVFAPEACLEEYALLKLHFRAAYKLIFQNAAIRALTRLVPALDELLVIGKLEHTVRTGGWDHVVVDAPVTGEGILLFLLPRVITEAVGGGPLHDDAARIRELLEDPARTVMHLVTLAEELPAEETEDLYRAMREQVGMPLGALLVDRLFPPRLEPRQNELLGDLALRSLGGAGPSLVEARDVVRFMAARRTHQERYLARLAQRVPLKRVELEEVFDAPDDLGVVTALAARLGNG
jgi:anion-transporting  ArsA/GET3 family ATPase